MYPCLSPVKRGKNHSVHSRKIPKESYQEYLPGGALFHFDKSVGERRVRQTQTSFSPILLSPTTTRSSTFMSGGFPAAPRAVPSFKLRIDETGLRKPAAQYSNTD